jgi:molybdopterin-biosynthesis enzyme MoeA-like protein
VPDDLTVIAKELRRHASETPDLIITLGGLGPTDDDMTLQGVAEAFALDLATDGRALSIVQERYRRLEAEGRVSKVSSADAEVAREKMASIPVGAEPLDNQVGAAPGVVTRGPSGVVVLSLPGVPAEMKQIFQEQAHQLLSDVVGAGFFVSRRLITNSNDESAIAPALRETAQAFDKVYVKSRPRRFDEGVRIAVTLAIAGDDRRGLEQLIDAADSHLNDALARRGVEVVTRDSETR